MSSARPPLLETADLSKLPASFTKAKPDQQLYSTRLPGFLIAFNSITVPMEAGVPVADSDHVTGTLFGKPSALTPAVTGVAHYEGAVLHKHGVLAEHQAQATVATTALGLRAYHFGSLGRDPHLPTASVFITTSRSIATKEVTADVAGVGAGETPAVKPVAECIVYHLRDPDLRRSKFFGKRLPTPAEIVEYINGKLALFKSHEEYLQALIRKTPAEGGVSLAMLNAPESQFLKTLAIPLSGANVFGWDPQLCYTLTAIAWQRFVETHPDKLLESTTVYNDQGANIQAAQRALSTHDDSPFNGEIALSHIAGVRAEHLNDHGQAFSFAALHRSALTYRGKHQAIVEQFQTNLADPVKRSEPYFGVSLSEDKKFKGPDLALTDPSVAQSPASCLFAEAARRNIHALTGARVAPEMKPEEPGL